MAIKLKHLSREFDIDPYKLRAVLRQLKIKTQSNGRYTWEEGSKPLQRVKTALRNHLSSSTSTLLPTKPKSPSDKT